jgi:uncharacterized membrane protein YraQ (UPF0718 family)
MASSLLVLAIVCLVLALIALVGGGPSRLGEGVRQAGALLISVAPQLALGFLLAGLVVVVVPPASVAHLVGHESGFAGLLAATGLGLVTPGGPFLQFPLVAAMLRNGAAEGPVAAYLTAWSLLGVHKTLVWEIPVLGPSFALTRWFAALGLPLLVGVTVPFLLRLLRQM